MADINKYSPSSGRFIGEDGKTYNLVDLLGGGASVGEIMRDINKYAPKSGRVIGEDGKIYNLVDLLKNFSGGGGALLDGSVTEAKLATDVVEKFETINTQLAQTAQELREKEVKLRTNFYEPNGVLENRKKIHLLPFEIETKTIVNRVKFEIVSDIAGSNYEIGIYDSSYNLVSDSYIKETIVGVNEVSLSHAVLEVGTYYLAFTCNDEQVKLKGVQTDKALSSEFSLPLPNTITNIYEESNGIYFELYGSDIKEPSGFTLTDMNGIRVFATGTSSGLFGWNTKTGKVCKSVNRGDSWTDLMNVPPGGFWNMVVDQTNNVIFTLNGNGEIYKSSDLTATATWENITPPKREQAISLPSSIELWNNHLWYGEYSSGTKGELDGGPKVFRYSIATGEWKLSKQFSNARHVHSFTPQGTVSLYVMLGDQNLGADVGYHRLTASGINDIEDNWEKWTGYGGENSTLYNITSVTGKINGQDVLLGSCDQPGSLVTYTKINNTVKGKANISPLIRSFKDSGAMETVNGVILDSRNNLYFRTGGNGGTRRLCVSPPPYSQVYILADPFDVIAVEPVRSGENIFYLDKKITAVDFGIIQKTVIPRKYVFRENELLPLSYSEAGEGEGNGAINPDNIYIESSIDLAGKAQRAGYSTTNKIDTTGYKKIIIEGEFLPSQGDSRVLLSISDAVDLESTVKEVVAVNPNQFVPSKIRLDMDISENQGLYHIQVASYTSQTNALSKLKIDKIYLSKI